MVQIMPPAGWDANAGAMSADLPSVSGEAALSLSTAGSVIFPAGALEDLSAVAEALGTHAGVMPTEVTPSTVLPPPDFDKLSPVEPRSPVRWWAVGGVASAILVGG